MRSQVSRREFLQSGVGATMAATLHASKLQSSPVEDLLPAPASALQRNVSFAMIGVGMQGSSLFKRAVALPGVTCVAACDLYDERLVLAREIAGTNIYTTRSYKELLADSSIDSLIVATPDHWHRRLVTEAVHAGKDVYCEKPLSHSVAEGSAMVAAVKETGRIVQVGSQVTSSPLYAKARSLLSEGAVGDVSLVELAVGRNNPTGAWEYPVPADLSEQTLDWRMWLGDRPQRPFDPLLFARWRCWREFGTGVAGDLMVHLVSGMLYMLGINQMPSRCVSAGGTVRWKDGRDLPDLQCILLEYGKLVVSVRLTLDTETPNLIRVLGSRGILQLSGTQLTLTRQSGIDLRPSYYDAGLPRALRDAYERQWQAEHASALAALPRVNEVETFESAGADDTVAHLQTFFTAVADRKPVVQDAVFGNNAAAACHMANQSFLSGVAVTRETAL